jgi:hypothetical protein
MLMLMLMRMCTGCLLAPASAAPPLLVAADLGEVGMQTWWRQGELLAGNPQAEGRPGLRPLEDANERLTLPADLSGWTSIGSRCGALPTASTTLDGQKVTVSIVTDPISQQIVRLAAADTILAENTLGRPAKICSIHIVEADRIPGPEILVSWRLGSGDPATTVNGLTVFRVPETARY